MKRLCLNDTYGEIQKKIHHSRLLCIYSNVKRGCIFECLYVSNAGNTFYKRGIRTKIIFARVCMIRIYWSAVELKKIIGILTEIYPHKLELFTNLTLCREGVYEVCTCTNTCTNCVFIIFFNLVLCK